MLLHHTPSFPSALVSPETRKKKKEEEKRKKIGSDDLIWICCHLLANISRSLTIMQSQKEYMADTADTFTGICLEVM